MVSHFNRDCAFRLPEVNDRAWGNFEYLFLFGFFFYIESQVFESLQVSYAVFDRITNIYLGSFQIADGKTIDGTYDTDGIDVTSIAFPEYPKGFFIAQDGANTQGKDSLNQNFKLVNWKSIETALELEKK